MRTWSNGKDCRARKATGRRNGGKDTIAQIRRHRYDGKDTATPKQWQRNGGKDTAAQKKASQPYRMTGGLRCAVSVL